MELFSYLSILLTHSIEGRYYILTLINFGQVSWYLITWVYLIIFNGLCNIILLTVSYIGN